MRIGVVGAFGNMGEAISSAVESDDDLVLSVRVGANDELKHLVDSATDVVIDVTNAEAARENLPWIAMHGMHAVVGTTGLTEAELVDIGRQFEMAGTVCFLVPNFSIGAVLMMRFAEQAAPYFDGVEVIEMHHNNKVDAPSGTAALTARRIAAARTEPWGPDATQNQTAEGARGGEVGGIHVHSVRLPGLLAHQEVMFGSAGQVLTIRHDSLDRSSFMPGVLWAVTSLHRLPPGLTVGLDAVL